ncbi:hypothetical protein HK105_205086 [Polyrhizophydium stewartii]|uniref:Uncharacterized protein n=1 Tax=Polyrhizophydium stewartii TaxID=2732419 RepID=A0ABR4N7L1_9FUNG|nr:hypothetical protein HK105_005774 [Polyrhizophydium stewartii]
MAQHRFRPPRAGRALIALLAALNLQAAAQWVQEVEVPICHNTSLAYRTANILYENAYPISPDPQQGGGGSISCIPNPSDVSRSLYYVLASTGDSAAVWDCYSTDCSNCTLTGQVPLVTPLQDMECGTYFEITTQAQTVSIRDIARKVPTNVGSGLIASAFFVVLGGLSNMSEDSPSCGDSPTFGSILFIFEECTQITSKSWVITKFSPDKDEFTSYTCTTGTCRPSSCTAETTLIKPSQPGSTRCERINGFDLNVSAATAIKTSSVFSSNSSAFSWPPPPASSSTTASTTTSTATASSTPASTPTFYVEPQAINLGLIVGSSVGGCVLLAILAGIMLLAYTRLKIQRKNERDVQAKLVEHMQQIPQSGAGTSTGGFVGGRHIKDFLPPVLEESPSITTLGARDSLSSSTAAMANGLNLFVVGRPSASGGPDYGCENTGLNYQQQQQQQQQGMAHSPMFHAPPPPSFPPPSLQSSSPYQMPPSPYLQAGQQQQQQQQQYPQQRLFQQPYTQAPFQQPPYEQGPYQQQQYQQGTMPPSPRHGQQHQQQPQHGQITNQEIAPPPRLPGHSLPPLSPRSVPRPMPMPMPQQTPFDQQQMRAASPPGMVLPPSMLPPRWSPAQHAHPNPNLHPPPHSADGSALGITASSQSGSDYSQDRHPARGGFMPTSPELNRFPVVEAQPTIARMVHYSAGPIVEPYSRGVDVPVPGPAFHAQAGQAYLPAQMQMQMAGQSAMPSVRIEAQLVDSETAQGRGVQAESPTQPAQLEQPDQQPMYAASSVSSS